MIYMLIELRGSQLPLLSQFTNDLVNQDFLDSLDHKYEQIIRVNDNIFEKYNPENKTWIPLNKIGT